MEREKGLYLYGHPPFKSTRLFPRLLQFVSWGNGLELLSPRGDLTIFLLKLSPRATRTRTVRSVRNTLLCVEEKRSLNAYWRLTHRMDSSRYEYLWTSDRVSIPLERSWELVSFSSIFERTYVWFNFFFEVTEVIRSSRHPVPGFCELFSPFSILIIIITWIIPTILNDLVNISEIVFRASGSLNTARAVLERFSSKGDEFQESISIWSSIIKEDTERRVHRVVSRHIFVLIACTRSTAIKLTFS